MKWFLAALLVVGLVGAPRAGAEVAGDCEVHLEGVDVEDRDADDPDEAVSVPTDRSATLEIRTQEPIDRWNASLVYGPFEAPLTRGEAPVNATRAQAGVPVGDFSWLGTGLYQVQGDVEMTDGSTCRGEVLVDVEGDTLGTVLGTTAAAITALGTLGLVASVRTGYAHALHHAGDRLGDGD